MENYWLKNASAKAELEVCITGMRGPTLLQKLRSEVILLSRTGTTELCDGEAESGQNPDVLQRGTAVVWSDGLCTLFWVSAREQGKLL